MFRVEGKVAAPALQREPAALGHNAGTKAEVVGVHEGHGVPLLIHHLEAHRARTFGGAALGHVHGSPVANKKKRVYLSE